MSNKKEKKKIDFVVDATNVTGWHNINVKDQAADNSLDAVLLLANILCERKHSFLFIFDANTIYKLSKVEQGIYNQLLKNFEQEFYQVTGGQRADDYVLAVADKFKSKIISTDRYRDYSKRYKWLDKSESRLIKGGVMSIIDEMNLMIPTLDIAANLNISSKELYKKLALQMGKITPIVNDSGKIKSYNANTQWGFIQNEKGEEIYFKGADFKIIGLPVKFKKHTETDRVFAKNVEANATASSAKTNENFDFPDSIEGQIEWFDTTKNLGLVKAKNSNKKYTFKKEAFEHKDIGVDPGLDVRFIPIEKEGKNFAFQLRLANLAERFLLKAEVDKMLARLENYKADASQLINLNKNKFEGTVEEVSSKHAIIKVANLNNAIFYSKSPKSTKVNIGDKVSFIITSKRDKLTATALTVLETATEKPKAEQKAPPKKAPKKTATPKAKQSKSPTKKAKEEKPEKSAVKKVVAKTNTAANKAKPQQTTAKPTPKPTAKPKQVPQKTNNILEALPGESISANINPNNVDLPPKKVHRRKVVRKTKKG